MEITAKELRGKPGRIIEEASRGTEIIITLRGKRAARLLPYDTNVNRNKETDDDIFGLWKDRDDIQSVDEYVRSLRKRRSR